MPFDTKAMARAVVAEATLDPHELWLLEQGIRKRTVRLDLSLRDSGKTLHTLRWLCDELPNVCARVEREKDESRRLSVAQSELRMIGMRTAQSRHRQAMALGTKGVRADTGGRSIRPLDAEILKGSVRLDLPLRQSAEILYILRWLCDELPAACTRIERENTEERRLLVAQMDLRMIADRMAPSRRRARAV